MKTTRAVLGLAILTLIMCLALNPTIANAQQTASNVVTQSKGEVAKTTVQSELTAARDSGTADGTRESTSGAIVGSVVYSSFVPGLGLIQLMGLNKEAAKARVDNMTYLTDRTPAYRKTYATSFDNALIPRYKKTVLISTGVGSVLGVLFWTSIVH